VRAISGDELSAAQVQALGLLSKYRVSSGSDWHKAFKKQTVRFSRVCAYCNQIYVHHSQNKCLFSPTSFKRAD
jgi:hypothetical protein